MYMYPKGKFNAQCELDRDITYTVRIEHTMALGKAFRQTGCPFHEPSIQTLTMYVLYK